MSVAFATIPLRRALATAVRAARAAGDLMRANLHSPKRVAASYRHDIKLKLDVRCQRRIERILRRDFPGTAILGEEGVVGDADAPWRWVVDPIDGTVNFAHGIPHACVSIALQRRRDAPAETRSIQAGEAYADGYDTMAGVVLDPFAAELWTAVRGGPARLNGRAIAVSQRPLREAIVTVGFAKHRASLERMLPMFDWLAHRVRKIRIMGSAALALTYVASGRMEAYVETGLRLWDIAAGGLILECAGGRYARRPIAGDHAYAINANNGRLHRALTRAWPCSRPARKPSAPGPGSLRRSAIYLGLLLGLLGMGFGGARAGTLAQFATPLGDWLVELEDAQKPVTVANFLRYVDSGVYRDMFLHRCVPGFVIQGGGYGVTNIAGQYFTQPTPSFGTITNEYAVGVRLSNTYGTMAMAKVPSNPNSASSQWFFNLANNATNLDNQNGGFTVFGHVVAGTNTLERFNAFKYGAATNRLLYADASLDALPVLGTDFVVDQLVFARIRRVDRPALQLAPRPDGLREIAWQSLSNLPQRLEVATSLLTANWTAILRTNGTGGPVRVVDPAPAGPARFYRVVVGD